jgi:hypothetical protein
MPSQTAFLTPDDGRLYILGRGIRAAEMQLTAIFEALAYSGWKFSSAR